MDEQRSPGETPGIGDFVSEFGESTLENWQSELLQLVSFVVLAALFVHKASAESKDSDEKMEASLRRIEEKLGTLPPDAPQSPDERWKLPDTQMDPSDGSPAGGRTKDELLAAARERGTPDRSDVTEEELVPGPGDS